MEPIDGLPDNLPGLSLGEARTTGDGRPVRRVHMAADTRGEGETGAPAGGFWQRMEREHPRLAGWFANEGSESGPSESDDSDDFGLHAEGGGRAKGDYRVLEKNDEANKFEKTISYKGAVDRDLQILFGENVPPDPDGAARVAEAYRRGREGYVHDEGAAAEALREEERQQARLQAMRARGRGRAAARSGPLPRAPPVKPPVRHMRRLFGGRDQRHPLVKAKSCVLCEYAMSMTSESANAMNLIILNDLKYVGMPSDLHLFQALTDLFNVFHEDLQEKGGRGVFVELHEMATHMLRHTNHNPLRKLHRMVMRNEYILENGINYIFGTTADGQCHWNAAKTKLYVMVQRDQRSLLAQIEILRLKLKQWIEILETQLANAHISTEKYSIVGGHVGKYTPRNIQ